MFKKDSYNQIVERIIKGLIYFALIISIWIISSVGLKIIPLLYFDYFSSHSMDTLNNVLLNLSYSYFTGFTVYFFTVSLPLYNRKRIMLPLVNNYIDNFVNFSILDFLMFYNNSDLIDDDIKKHPFVKDLFNVNNMSRKMIDTLSRNNDYKNRKKILIKLLNKSILFFGKIQAYESFLSTKQLTILNDIRQDDFLSLSEYYDDTMEEMDDMKGIFFKRFEKYTKNIYLLKQTIL